MASLTEKGLPSSFDCGKADEKSQLDLATTKNVKWAFQIDEKTLGSPVVSNGKVFIGTSSTSSGPKAACLFCLDEQTGRELGRFLFRKPAKGDHIGRCLENWGVCSTPTIEGDRLYLVSPFQEVLCLDLKAWLGPNAYHPVSGTVQVAAENKTLEDSLAASEKCIAWKYDLARELKSIQDHTSSCSVVVNGDFVYVCTGNGRFMKASEKVPFHPLTPSLVVFNKKTGQLVARDDEQIGERLWRGQWSSPSMGVVGKQEQIYFSAGDGTCYAFQPVAPNTQVIPNRWVTTTLRGPIVKFIDVKPPPASPIQVNGPAQSPQASTSPTNSVVQPALPSPAPANIAVQQTVASPAPTASPAQPTPASPFPVETRTSIDLPVCSPLDALPTAQVPDVPILRKIWWFDCIPKEYRKNPFYANDAKSDGNGRPCEIMGTPVFYRNRVYIAIGGDPRHGGRDSKGNLVCIDATKTGDITKTGQIWSYDKINQCASTVAIADGLVYALDESGVVHCLDADTGHPYWTYCVVKGRGVESTSCSPFVADGKLFVGKNILAAGRELKPLVTELIGSPAYPTPCAANGVLFTVHGKWLYAICNKGGQ